ncbi:MAG: dienelactone hydrolase family protein, partial [Chitinophagaceae bacterium]
MLKFQFAILSLLVLLSYSFNFGNKESIMPVRALTCMSPASEDPMIALFNDPSFVAMHLSPIPINFQAKGKMISYPSPDEKNASAYLIKTEKKSNKWLFVFQEWWGLNDHIKKQADILFDELNGEVNVIALDLYDGFVTADPKEAGAMIRNAKEERIESIIKGATNYAGKKAKIANIGWCFGGAWSLRSGILNGDHTIGTVMYYGMPVKDVDKLKTLNGDVLGLFATEQYISKEIIEEFAAKMKEAGKELDYKIFNGVHGFANPSNPKFD